VIDTINILQTINLAQLIGRDTETVKGGRMYCPFCQVGGRDFNNAPALSVRGQYYHCFGCGANGDAIDYVMQSDKVDFIEACHRLGWDGHEPDKAEVERRKNAQQIKAALERDKRAADLDALLADYSAEEIWLAYNRRMGVEQRAAWESWGIPPGWQDYLQLGYTPDKIYRGKDGNLYHSAAYTIPYFHPGNQFQTMQYRLSDPENPQDRYRFERGLSATWYMTQPGKEINEWAVICEGAKKAMVTDIWGDTGDDVTILAVPSKETFAGIAQAVSHCKKVWICLDPDCWTEPKNAAPGWEPAPVKLAKLIGKSARIVRLPAKMDDALLSGLTPGAWKAALRDAQGL
jgi:hypothetical protein